jgi:beta-lactamase regulating signal transducer with metallopeptidase domain
MSLQRMEKERKDVMNESKQQKQPKKESFVQAGILLAIMALGLLALLLKAIGLF